MNVALFLTYDYSIKTWSDSGTLKKELNIYKELNKKHNIKFTIFSYGNEDDITILKNEVDTEEISVIPIYSFIRKIDNKYLRFLKSLLLPFLLRKKIKNISIIQQHQLYGIWVSLLLSKILNIPYYLRTGYDVYSFSIYENKNILKIYFNKKLTKMGLKYSNIYSVTSKTDLEFLKNKFNINNSKIKIRPNWVMNNNKVPILKRNRKKLLSIGRLVDQKYFSLLIKEFSGTKDELEIEIIGDGSELNNLKNLAKENQVRLKIIRNLNNDEILKKLNESTFFVSSSKFEGNPKTVLEAMSSGCIVFASDIKAHSELIKNDENGILYNLDNPELYKIYKDLTLDEQKILKISNEASNHILRNNLLDNITELYFQDYQLISSR